MKTLLTLLLLLVASIAVAGPASVGFRSYSAAGITNYPTTCAVLAGKQQANGAFDAVILANYAMTKGGTGSFTVDPGYDYKISCVQTASPKDAITVKLFFNGSETNFFPTSSLVLSRQP